MHNEVLSWSLSVSEVHMVGVAYRLRLLGGSTQDGLDRRRRIQKDQSIRGKTGTFASCKAGAVDSVSYPYRHAYFLT